MNERILILKPFNLMFWLMSAFFFLILAGAGYLLKDRPEEIKRNVLVCFGILTLVCFFIYKYLMSLDAEYNIVYAEMGGFVWWGELPLHLCNVNMILMPLAVHFKNRHLTSFCFFLGPLGATLALLMPGNAFIGYSVLLPRMLGYYGTHFMVIIGCLAPAVFGLFRPSFRDIPGTMITAGIIALGIFLINVLLRTSGLHPKANYFYLMETEGNFVLDLFYSLLPIPFLYLLPAFPIMFIYMCLITACFELAGRMKQKKPVQQ